MKYQDITGEVIGAAMRVHSEIGNGFPEIIYQRALAIELKEMNMSFKMECSRPVLYKGQNVGARRMDFLVEDKICVELKSLPKLELIHFAQTRNYLELLTYLLRC
jgi:GxxExxY protein